MLSLFPFTFTLCTHAPRMLKAWNEWVELNSFGMYGSIPLKQQYISKIDGVTKGGEG